ncbi:hypothetical protein [Sphingobium boeckii]|uniref:Uncharacterized protein n=1 Tax=Sphingobium boeckii TaxID=1082345 RepID=A0A7W9AFS6_9SPHN|nr:hypothetical protein [Sphingobium boeckii]MBB5684717.1 hypothetical protein [Sphingobium boeckii]
MSLPAPERLLLKILRAAPAAGFPDYWLTRLPLDAPELVET